LKSLTTSTPPSFFAYYNNEHRSLVIQSPLRTVARNPVTNTCTTALPAFCFPSLLLVDLATAAPHMHNTQLLA